MSTLTLDSLNTQIVKCLAEFKATNRPHVDSILNLAKTIFTANETLSSRDFKLFARHHELGVWEKALPVRLRHFLSIGAAEAVLRPYADSLPATITTLNHLSRHSSSALADFIKDGTVHRMMTGEDAYLLAIDTRIPMGAEKARVDGARQWAQYRERKRIDGVRSDSVEDDTEETAAGPAQQKEWNSHTLANGNEGRVTLTGYAVAIDWITADFDVKKAREFLSVINAYIHKHAERYGLDTELTLTGPLRQALLADQSAHPARIVDAA